MAAVVLAAGCSGGDDSIRLDYPSFEPDQSAFSDRELLQAVYTAYRYPIDFYREDLAGSIYYVNTVSVTPLEDRTGPSEPLCSDDYTVASNWAELSNEHSSVRRNRINERETEKYFEFEMKNASSDHILLLRVSKCDYFVANRGRFWDENQDIGTLAREPRTPDSLQELAEYLWFTSHYNQGGASALSSFSVPASEGQLIHVLFDIETSFGDYGLHDRITLREHVFSLSLDNGIVHHEGADVRTINGQYNPDPFGGWVFRP